jgi:pimeloyl-ACP methyl ester carboxylesterase
MTSPIAKQFLPLPSSAEHPAYQAAYWEAGSGETLVFLHGFLGSGAYWRSLVDLLSPHYHCICLDMLGFGDSSKPKIRYDIAKLVAFVHETLTALGLSSYTLVGHSLGSWVSAAYTLAYPDFVQQLILTAPAGIRDDSFCGRYDAYRPLLWQTPLIDLALWSAQPIATLLGKQKDLSTIRWYRRELNAQPAGRSFIIDRMRPEDAIDTIEHEIHRLRVPTLIIAAECDETIPQWHSDTYAKEIPGAQLVRVPEAGHGLLPGYAGAIAVFIEQFLGMG